jgi:transposase
MNRVMDPPHHQSWSSPPEPDTPIMGGESPKGESNWTSKRNKRDRRRDRDGSSVTGSSVMLWRSSRVLGSRLLRSPARCGVYDSTLGNWVKQDEINRGVRDGVTTTEREEIVGLRRENAHLRMERELLKRAVVFWVRESVRHEALVKRAVMKGHRGLVVVAAG